MLQSTATYWPLHVSVGLSLSINEKSKTIYYPGQKSWDTKQVHPSPHFHC